MTPEQFIEKWKASELNESAAAQSHFNDLCALLDEQTPTDADPKGEWYCFEKGAIKTTGAKGWADVWKRHRFGWEYKGPGKNLDKAFAQLQQYAVALENPPLLVVCDTERFRIHTNWTNTVSEVHEITLDDLMDANKRAILKSVFSDPEQLKPTLTRDALTQDMASRFAGLAQQLRDAGHEPHEVAHFLNRLVFCMFAEDVNLLPKNLFTVMLEAVIHHPEQFEENAKQLFGGMKDGGVVAFNKVEWFNGGLFDDDEALPLTRGQIEVILKAARMDWSAIDPSILGTLFERGLDPDKRSQLGAHYTDRDKVMMIIDPVIKRPLESEWSEIRSHIERELDKAEKARNRRPKTQAEARKVFRTARQAEERAKRNAVQLRNKFLQRLRDFKILDPACGSGNFLYLGLMTLKDFEHRINLECEGMGLPKEFPSIGPEVVKGIEINPYAAELARVSIWIGEIQWMKRNGFEVGKNPILKPLNSIECRDAILDSNGDRASWPSADVVIGNPPFLGNKKMIEYLGEDYVSDLRNAYADWLGGGVDLVMHWFETAWRLIEGNRLTCAGLVGTNSIRGGANRKSLDRIVENGRIFDAWSDEEWTVEGAAVRVSLVCFDNSKGNAKLNGSPVKDIYSNLTASVGETDTSKSALLKQNLEVCFQGTIKTGPFDVRGDQARDWVALPLNPNGEPNATILRLWSNGKDVTNRPSDHWIIDFGCEMSETDAAFFEGPILYLHRAFSEENQRRAEKGKRPLRSREANALTKWWLHQRPRPKMRQALDGLSRYIATPRLAKHRLFVWMDKAVLPDCQLIVTARDDDTTFGILHSCFHRIWALRLGTSLEDRPRYTLTSTFETFPFPEGLSPDVPATDYEADPRAQRIAEAAAQLNELRENWLNPADITQRVPEVVPGYPDRILPVDEDAAKQLKKRTLTKLYNQRPAWLENAHQELDSAVAAAYGWPANLSDDEVLEKLLELNLSRATSSKKD